MPPTHPNVFPRSHRLTAERDFAAVLDARVRKAVAALSVWARPNDLDHWRLGLSVSRRVGTAVQRNRIKRLLREAFRLGQHAWPCPAAGPGGYDMVVIVRPHAPATLADYRRWLDEAAGALHRQWRRSGKQQNGKPTN